MSTQGDSGLTPLHVAAERGDDGVVQELPESFADPNAKDDHMLTPLQVAARGENVNVVKLLLDFGADVMVRDHPGSTILFFPLQLDIAQVLFEVFSTGEQHNQEYEAQDYPMFPIAINGITLDRAIEPTAGSIETNYILVQSRIALGASNTSGLDAVGVEILNYVSKNTYLCQWQGPGRDLNKIRQQKPVVYVDIYRREFKIGPTLKRALSNEPEQLQTYEVDVIWHKSVSLESADIVAKLERESQCYGQIQVFTDFARLSIEGRYLDSVASIDEVLFIEAIGGILSHPLPALAARPAAPAPAPTPSSNQRYQGQQQEDTAPTARPSAGSYQQNPSSAGRRRAVSPDFSRSPQRTNRAQRA
ncbi:hypothetical protein O1611_g3900 [Lasiodiplodia mahajangana]|uniref:Uncharacterized protein n=1 Tax=Lasiodiplodia mahajangana TaxID=1108764 RepID=A0ACC2JRA9_9PEZI|nr:hypothetical protein O1611_g3900 [Lasiodiplodia mahajangana]